MSKQATQTQLDQAETITIEEIAVHMFTVWNHYQRPFGMTFKEHQAQVAQHIANNAHRLHEVHAETKIQKDHVNSLPDCPRAKARGWV